MSRRLRLRGLPPVVMLVVMILFPCIALLLAGAIYYFASNYIAILNEAAEIGPPAEKDAPK